MAAWCPFWWDDNHKKFWFCADCRHDRFYICYGFGGDLRHINAKLDFGGGLG